MQFGDDGKINKLADVKYEEMSCDEFFEELTRISSYFPEMNILDIVLAFYRGLCLASLVDVNALQLMSLENAISKYHQLPYPGSYLEQPKGMLDAFDIIRGAIISYENKMLENAKSESRKTEKVK
jgi:hypothetical protein